MMKDVEQHTAPGADLPTPRVARRRQTRIAMIAALGGFLFGYDTGVIAGALVYISADLSLGPVAQGWVVSSLLLGAAFGATFGGRISDKFGRKPVIQVSAAIFVIATLGSAFAPGAAALLLFRVLLGFAVGCVSAVVPIYIGEIASADRRGRLVNQNELMIVFDECFVATVTWLMLSEIFPMKIRGFAMGVCVFLLWIVDFAISELFPIVNAAAGSFWTFLIFVGFGILAIWFVTACVPETKGRTLEDLESGFRDRYSKRPAGQGRAGAGSN
jgi:MFS family permease